MPPSLLSQWFKDTFYILQDWIMDLRWEETLLISLVWPSLSSPRLICSVKNKPKIINTASISAKFRLLVIYKRHQIREAVLILLALFIHWAKRDTKSQQFESWLRLLACPWERHSSIWKTLPTGLAGASLAAGV